jgi:hypothetical protein
MVRRRGEDILANMIGKQGDKEVLATTQVEDEVMNRF